MKNRLKIKILYAILHTIMFGESFVWTVMDILRSARMRVVRKIAKKNHE